MVQKRACDACHKRKVRTRTHSKSAPSHPFLGALAYLVPIGFTPLDPPGSYIHLGVLTILRGTPILSTSLTQLQIQCDSGSPNAPCNWCEHQGLECTFNRVRGRKKQPKPR